MNLSVRSAFLILVLGLWALFLAHPSFAQTALKTESFELDQCAIVQSSDHPRVFLTDSTGELTALDVPTGKVLWHGPKDAYPLLARGNRLLALMPPAPGKVECDLAVLDGRNGKVIKRLKNSTGQPLASPVEGISNSFHTQGITQDNRDVVVWTETWRPMPGGAYKGPDYVYPSGSSGQKQGLLVVDLAGGNILPPSGYYPATSLRSQSNPWGGYSTEPFKVDDITAQVEMQMINGKDLLVLRRWNGTDSLPEVRLGEPPWNSCGVVVCGDRRNVLGVWQVPEKKDPFLYHLNIFSTATGEKTAEVNATSWPSTAQLCGNYLVGYFPNRVFAINITTGKEVWSQLIKDLMYHGPYPPSAAPGRPIAKPEETE